MRIAIIGLGYVGLPLMVSLSSHFEVIGYDVNETRVAELKKGFDRTCEIQDPKRLSSLTYSTDVQDLEICDVYIVTVPTPITNAKIPDLTQLKNASELVGRVLSKGNTVIFESTVFPGATRDICIPIIEKMSNFEAGVDFDFGYSPERINPGDKKNNLSNVIKVISASSQQSLMKVDTIYSAVVTAGTYKAASIEVAEAAKVLENVQRDVNIGLMNEISVLCEKLNLSVYDVLGAAGSKWNFLPFEPGLVGGHCIGVDPYYLTFKAKEVGYHPELILAGRRINDSMPEFICNKLIKTLTKSKFDISTARFLIMGLTFKEDCPDMRNSKVYDLYHELLEYGVSIDVYDPVANREELSLQYDKYYEKLDHLMGPYDAIIVAVKHSEFLSIAEHKYTNLLSENGIIFDLKNALNQVRTRVTM